jgi:hypothetical protein
MSSAHVFYIPLMILCGVAVGYFLGMRAAEGEARQRQKRRERRERRRARSSRERRETSEGQGTPGDAATDDVASSP